MAVEATTAPPVTATSTATSSSSNGSTSAATLANNFQTFLTLLTTQLQNQNPLDPLDTNQFTQQLVQFASVEQQLRQNDQLSTLVNLEKTAQSTAALSYVGYTAVVDGSKAPFDGTNSAAWTLKVPNDTNATITITNSTGQTVFSGSYALQKGNPTFTWDGKGNDGTQWPAGNYTLNVSGKDCRRQQHGNPQRSPGRGRFGRSHRLPAAALDRRPELHHRPDQARGASRRNLQLSLLTLR